MKIKSLIENVVAILYFVFVMWVFLLLFTFQPLLFIDEVKTITSTGFGTSKNDFMIIGAAGLVIGISLFVPAIRKMYYKLPWLYPYIKIMYINFIIMGIATLILNYGYEIQNRKRQITFFVIMIVQIIICRLGMCIYFNRRSIKHIGGEANERYETYE